jgi:hypothetical protein
MKLVKDKSKVYNNSPQVENEAATGCIRSPMHRTAFVPCQIPLQMTNHPLTDAGIKSFMSGWQQISKQ